MDKPQSIIKTIRRRTSWRTFRNTPLPPALRAKINDFLAQPLKAPFPGTWRFQLLERTLRNSKQPVKIGTYGTISGAREFIVGAIKADRFALLNYGYLMEQVILHLTGLGLGTCWLGATFHHRDFARLISAAPDELVPAVSPVGEPKPSRGVHDHIMDIYANARKRKPWSKRFFDGSFHRPLAPADAGAYAEPLAMLRLAPSASNRQPWRILHDRGQGAFHLYLHRNPLYIKLIHSMFAAHDLQQMDMGIAMCHFELTARELNLPGQWAVKDPGLAPPPPLTDYVISWFCA